MIQYDSIGVHFVFLVLRTTALLLVISLLGLPFSGCEHWLSNTYDRLNIFTLIKILDMPVKELTVLK